jgi:hypothetical protein
LKRWSQELLRCPPLVDEEGNGDFFRKETFLNSSEPSTDNLENIFCFVLTTAIVDAGGNQMATTAIVDSGNEMAAWSLGWVQQPRVMKDKAMATYLPSSVLLTLS